MDETVKLVERRAKRQLAKAKLFKNCQIVCLNVGSCRARINSYLVKKFIFITKKIRVVKKIPSAKYDFIFLPNSATIEAENLLKFMLKCQPTVVPQKNVMLLRDSTDKELIEYAKIQKIKFSSKDCESSDIIERLEKIHPGTIHALAKSASQIKTS